MTTSEHVLKWENFFADARLRVQSARALEVRGTLTRLTGLVLEAVGIRVPVGSQCWVRMRAQPPVLTEVVGFSGDSAYLMPAGDVHGLSSGASVEPAPAYVVAPRLGERRQVARDAGMVAALRLPLGDGLLGRVVDAHGNPMDYKGPIPDVTSVALDRKPINAMDRAPVREPLDTGIRAINALLTVGRGQRLGLFSGSGVGKSVLMGMMARYTQADVIVVGLIGERGREVKEFIEDILGEEGRARSVVVAAPADAPPLLRMQGAAYATAVAESFRDKGKHVLLLMDSLTRYAMAQREIALAIGEPPVTRGYPPSVFAKLPQLVERAGNGAEGGGSITAFYTVLVEGDDLQDPIADSVRAILDGHIVLSRLLADQGHYPAIDIEASISRVLPNIVPPQQLELVRRFRALYARYQRSRDLISVGAYSSGHDAALDQAIQMQPQLERFLQQGMRERQPYAGSVNQLAALFPPENVPLTT